jgi:hypothetical protein
MQTRGLRAAIELRGLWLNPGPVRTSIKPLLLHMLERTHPDPVLREAVLEELQRRTKFKDVIFRALGGCPRISVIGSLNPGWPIDYTPGWGTALDITLSLQGHGGSSASRRSAPGHLKPIDEAPYGLDRAQTTPIAPNLEQIMR